MRGPEDTKSGKDNGPWRVQAAKKTAKTSGKLPFLPEIAEMLSLLNLDHSSSISDINSSCNHRVHYSFGIPFSDR